MTSDKTKKGTPSNASQQNMNLQKASIQNRANMAKTILNLISFIQRQAPVRFVICIDQFIISLSSYLTIHILDIINVFNFPVIQLSVKKSLDLVGEKMSSTLLPDTTLLDSILDDERITDPLEFMNKICKEFPPVTLAEGNFLFYAVRQILSY